MPTRAYLPSTPTDEVARRHKEVTRRHKKETEMRSPVKGNRGMYLTDVKG